MCCRTLYMPIKSRDVNWTVARCADDVVLDIATGEELVANLQDNSFAINAISSPNNYLYDAEGNLLWEAAGKVTDAVGPTINYSDFVISGYSDDANTIDGFYNVETGEARFLEDFYAVDIKHFPENGNTLSPEKMELQ